MIGFKPRDPNVVGPAFGDVYPPLGPLSGTGFNAREHALRALKKFMACLVFERRMADGKPPQRFMVPKEQIHVYQPDDVKDVQMPFTIGIRPSKGTHETVNLGPAAVSEDTRDVFGPGTVLIDRAEWDEQIAIEVLAPKHAQRVALVNGLEEALTMWEESYALRLKLPDYYDQVAAFELVATEFIDDDPVFRNRRRADLYVNLAVSEVSLVRYVPFQPEVMLKVGTEVDVEIDVQTDD
jgi:hypothetical protein